MNDKKKPTDPLDYDENDDIFDQSFDQRFQNKDEKKESGDQDLFILDDQFSTSGSQPEKSGDDQRATRVHSPEEKDHKDPFLDDRSEMEEINIDNEDLIQSPSPGSAPGRIKGSGESSPETDKEDGFLNIPEEPSESPPPKESREEESLMEIDLDEGSEKKEEEDYLELDFSSDQEENSQGFDDLEELFAEESKEIDTTRKSDFEVLSNSKELKQSEIKKQLDIAQQKAREQEERDSKPKTVIGDRDFPEPTVDHDFNEENRKPADTFPPSPEETVPSEPLLDNSESEEEILLESPVSRPEPPPGPTDRQTTGETPDMPPPPIERPEFQVPADSRKKTVIAGAIIVILLAVAAYFFVFKKDRKPSPVKQNQVAQGPPPSSSAASPARTTPKAGSSNQTQPDTSRSRPTPEKKKSPVPVDTDQTSRSRIAQEDPVDTGPVSETQSTDQRREEILENLRNMKSPEQLLFEEAREENSIEKYREYVSKYPRGEYYGEAISAINRLNKMDPSTGIKADITRKIQSRRKRTLPSTPRRYTQQEVDELQRTRSRTSTDTEKLAIGNQKILADYENGLIWHLWPKPMDLYKSSMFKARKYAEFTNWRLPTTQEALSFPEDGLSHFLEPGSGPVRVWTADASGSSQIVVDIRAHRIHLESSSSPHYLLVCKSL